MRNGLITYRIETSASDVAGKSYSQEGLYFALKQLMRDATALYQSGSGVYVEDVRDLPRSSGATEAVPDGGENLLVRVSERRLPDPLRGKAYRVLAVPPPIGWIEYTVDDDAVDLADGMVEDTAVWISQSDGSPGSLPLARSLRSIALEARALVALRQEGEQTVAVPYFERWVLGSLWRQLEDYVSERKRAAATPGRAVRLQVSPLEAVNSGWRVKLGSAAPIAEVTKVPASGGVGDLGSRLRELFSDRMSSPDVSGTWLEGPSVVARRLRTGLSGEPTEVALVRGESGHCLEFYLDDNVGYEIRYNACDPTIPAQSWLLVPGPGGISLRPKPFWTLCLTVSVSDSFDGTGGSAQAEPWVTECSTASFAYDWNDALDEYFAAKPPQLAQIDDFDPFAGGTQVQRFTMAAQSPGASLAKAGAQACPWEGCSVAAQSCATQVDTWDGFVNTPWTWKLLDMSSSGRINEGLFEIQQWTLPLGGLVPWGEGETASVGCVAARIASGLSSGTLKLHEDCQGDDLRLLWLVVGRPDGYFQVEALGQGVCWHLTDGEVILLPCDRANPHQAWAPGSECLAATPGSSARCIQTVRPAARRADGAPCQDDSDCAGVCVDNTCVVPGGLGAQCDTNADCSGADRALCSVADGVCVGADTAPCSDNDECERFCLPSYDDAQGHCGDVPGDWITIQGGSFQMGSDTYNSEQPVHTVTVPTFQMMKTEVPVWAYQACVTAGACNAPFTGSNYNYGVSGREAHPINGVSWTDAAAYCAWVGGRLPSESEWEYAARSRGQNITYPWGNDAATCAYAVMNDSNAGDSGCGEHHTWAVCGKTAGNTDQGLCDMAGNVWEWVRDWYHGSYDCGANPGAINCSVGGRAPADGTAWEAGGGSYRVVRGGGWYGSGSFLRAAYRRYSRPGSRYGYLGFRCARAPLGL